MLLASQGPGIGPLLDNCLLCIRKKKKYTVLLFPNLPHFHPGNYTEVLTNFNLQCLTVTSGREMILCDLR